MTQTRDAMKALARRANRFPRSIGGQTVHLDAQTVRSDGEKIGMSRRKTDMDRKMIGLGRRADTGSRMRSGSGPKSIHMNWKSFRSGDKSVRSDETAVGMTRTTIHITRKTNCAATDIDHAMIHTDRSRDPYGKRHRKTPERRSDSVRDRTEIRGWKSALHVSLRRTADAITG